MIHDDSPSSGERRANRLFSSVPMASGRTSFCSGATTLRSCRSPPKFASKFFRADFDDDFAEELAA